MYREYDSALLYANNRASTNGDISPNETEWTKLIDLINADAELYHSSIGYELILELDAQNPTMTWSQIYKYIVSKVTPQLVHE